MDPRWLVLSFALLAGCSQATHVEVPYEPPIKTDTSFANLPRILAAIPKSGSMRLYRGLPSEFWEPELRAQELNRAKTIRLHGYPFYERSIPIPAADAGRLTALLSSRATFQRHNEKKRCGGYSPEYGVEWKAGDDGIRALICLECAEVKMFVPKCELYCDLSPAAKQSLESSLGRWKLVDFGAVASKPAAPCGPVAQGLTSRSGNEGIRRAGVNAAEAKLRPGVAPDAAKLDRHSFVSSSCGACGKRSIAAVRVASRHPLIPGVPRLSPEVIHGLPRALRTGQSAFARTGGIHASGLFDADGRLLALREDLGRHNALDKLIGSELLAGRIPLSHGIVLVSGRVSFELVQKAAIAGVPVLAAVGAPSSLAVDLARERGMTLLGFVRDARFNVYSDFGRVDPAGTLTHSA